MSDNSHLFEEYLAGKLSPDELKTFENRLRDDSSFNQDFKTHEMALKVISVARQDKSPTKYFSHHGR